MSSHDSKSGGDKFKKFGKAKAISKFKVPAKKKSKPLTAASDGSPVDPEQADKAEQAEQADKPDEDKSAKSVAKESVTKAPKPEKAKVESASAEPVAEPTKADTSDVASGDVASGEVAASLPSVSSNESSSAPASQEPGPKRQRNDATSPLPADVLPDARPSATVAATTKAPLLKPTSALASPAKPRSAPKGKGRPSTFPSSAPTMKMGALVRPDEEPSTAEAPEVVEPKVEPEVVEPGATTTPVATASPSVPATPALFSGPKGKARSKAGVTTLPPPPGYEAPQPPPGYVASNSSDVVERAKPLPTLPQTSSPQSAQALPSPADIVAGRKSSQTSMPPPIPVTTSPASAPNPFAATQALSVDAVLGAPAGISSAPLSSTPAVSAPSAGRAASAAEEEAAAAAAIADLEGFGTDTVENSYVGELPVAPGAFGAGGFVPPGQSGYVTPPASVSGQYPAPPVSGQYPVPPGSASGQFPVPPGSASGQFPVPPGSASGQFPVPPGSASGQFPVPPGSASGQFPVPGEYMTPVPGAYADTGSGQFPVAHDGRPPRARTASDVAREAAWKQAHPSAKKWAKKREKGGAAGRRTPHPLRIALGMLMIGAGIYLLGIFIPAHEPAAIGDEVVKKWRFSDGQHSVAAGFAFGFLALGLFAAFRGATYRKSVVTHCGKCNMKVDAVRDGFSLKCQNGSHSAGIQFSSVGLLVTAVVLVVGILSLIMVAS